MSQSRSGFDDVVKSLRAAAEPTRLRILLVLNQAELTVSELCRVLGQTQPRVSRHLKLLVDGGLLERRAEGTSAFYRAAASGFERQLFTIVTDTVEVDDLTVKRDQERLDVIRAERAQIAAAYFERVAADWDSVRNMHVADSEVEAAMLSAVAHIQIDDLLDIGTGTGRILELFAGRIESGQGIDLSPQMLNLARTRLDQKGLSHCAVRRGDVYDLDAADGSVDVAVLHHVLHFLDKPGAAIAQAARAVRPGGVLLIIDFGSHHHEQLRTDFEHHRLGFDDGEVRRWCEDAGLVDISVQHLRLQDRRDEALTTTMWVASQHGSAPNFRPLEVAS